MREIRQSAISAFLECRRRWYWEHYRGIEPIPDGPRSPGTSEIGTLFHKAYEAWYDPDSPTRLILPAAKQALFTAAEDMAGDGHWDEDWEKAATLASIMFEGYVGWLEEGGEDAGEETLAVEQELRIVLPGTYSGERVAVYGKADHTLRNAESLLILDDAKTVSSSILSVMRHAGQLGRYAVMLRAGGHPAPQQVRTTQARRVKRTGTAKPPFYGRARLWFGPERYEAEWRKLHRTITEMVAIMQAIDAGQNLDLAGAVPSPGDYCDWKCKHLAICQAQDAGDPYETLVELAYRPKEDQ